MYILNECGLAIVNTSAIDAISIKYPVMSGNNYQIVASCGKGYSSIATYESLEEAKTALAHIFEALKYNMETLDLTKRERGN